MDQDNEAEIRKKLLNTEFYKPLKELDHIGLASSNFTTYKFNCTEICVQQLFQPLPNNDSGQYSQPSTSYATGPSNAVVQSHQPPPFKRILLNNCQFFGQTYIYHHGNPSKEEYTCCVCHCCFDDESSLKKHVDETIEAKMSCVEICRFCGVLSWKCLRKRKVCCICRTDYDSEAEHNKKYLDANVCCWCGQNLNGYQDDELRRHFDLCICNYDFAVFSIEQMERINS